MSPARDEVPGFVKIRTEDGPIWCRPCDIRVLGAQKRGRNEGDARELFIVGVDRPFFVLDTLDNEALWKALAQCGGTSPLPGPDIAALLVALESRLSVQLSGLASQLSEVRMDLATLQGQVAAANAALAAAETSTGNVAADIARILAALPTSGGLTEAEAQTLSSELQALQTRAQAVADSLSALDAQNPDTPATPADV